MNPRDLSVTGANKLPPPGGGYAIPTRLSREKVLTQPQARFACLDVLYGIRHEKDLRANAPRRQYLLTEPEPWLVVLVTLMRDAIIQGLTWEAAKFAARRAMDWMRSVGLAPPADQQRDRPLSERRRGGLQAGFSWTEYSKDGKPMREVFLGVKRAIEVEKEYDYLVGYDKERGALTLRGRGDGPGQTRELPTSR